MGTILVILRLFLMKVHELPEGGVRCGEHDAVRGLLEAQAGFRWQSILSGTLAMYVSGSGSRLLEASVTLLDRGFRALASAGEAQRLDQGSSEGELGARSLAGATVDVIVGQFLFRTGVTLIGEENELTGSLIDTFA